MDEKPLRITQGRIEAFLACDRSLERCDAPFFERLRKEGFQFAGYHGNYGCHWAHVNITRKVYAYGMPGIALVPAIGNHAITVREFWKIYSIYQKYCGKELFVFHSKRFDYDARRFHFGSCRRQKRRQKVTQQTAAEWIEEWLKDGVPEDRRLIEQLREYHVPDELIKLSLCGF